VQKKLDAYKATLGTVQAFQKLIYP